MEETDRLSCVTEPPVNVAEPADDPPTKNAMVSPVVPPSTALVEGSSASTWKTLLSRP